MDGGAEQRPGETGTTKSVSRLKSSRFLELMPTAKTAAPPAEFSLVSFVRSHLRDAEMKPGEGSRELAAVAAAGERAAKSGGGILRGHVLPITRAESGGLSTGTLASGGAMADPGAVTLAAALQPVLTVERLGARRVVGRDGDLMVSPPAAIDGFWVAEDQEVPTETALFGAAMMAAKDAAVRVKMSRNLFRQAGRIAESELRAILQRSISETIERGILAGQGGAALLGIVEDPQLQRETFTGTTALPSRERLAELIGELLDNGGDLESLAVLASSSDYGDSQAGAAPLVEHTADGRRRAAGVPVTFSPYLPSGQLIVADWSRLVISYIGEPQLIIDPHSDGDRGIINLTLFQSVSYATERTNLLTVAIKEA